MIIENTKEIKEWRKNKGITQAKLASMAGVSQSMIAKIESGIIEPSYKNMIKIIKALNKTKNDEEKAKNLMNKKIISFTPETKATEAIKIMKKKEISQAPVIKKQQVIGLISETNILKNIENIEEKTIAEIMSGAPPIMPEETNLKTIAEVLQEFPMTIIAEKGEIKGIITKSDILKTIIKKTK